MHAVILAAFLYLGFFKNPSLASLFGSALLTTIWAEIWHYGSHRAFHLRALHWIHVEHHKSHLNSPFTAISFSFMEKLVFDLGLLSPLALVDRLFFGLNTLGIAAWYIGYLAINSFSHANFELKSKDYNHWLGKVLTSATYHEWLINSGITWIALPDVPLDYSAVEEANLLAQGQPYLHSVWHNAHWRLWNVTDSPGLISGPARVTALEPSHVALDATGTGTAIIRIRYTPTWNVSSGAACVEPATGGWTQIVIHHPGPLQLTTTLLHRQNDCDTASPPP